jgi:simple sugar transport system permease protein
LARRWQNITLPLIAVLFSLLVGGLLILIAGVNPLFAYRALFTAGFGCRGSGGFCAVLTTLQYTTPLILSGLSATIAFRTGLFSIGQAGQMLLGAAAATFLANRLSLSTTWIVIIAFGGGAAAGAIWGFIPGFLKAMLGVNEVISTLLLNPIAFLLIGPVSFWRIPEWSRLAPLVPTTKLNAGIVIALSAALFAYIYLWRMAPGFELRTTGKSPTFARYGGIQPRRAIMRAMTLSGALAGLAGAIEVIGVQYRFVTTFSSIDQFDGVIVALIGQQHPLGVVVTAFLLGGVRLGTINGLQLEAGVPRELGNALIALTALVIASPKLYRWLQQRSAAVR